MAIFKIDKSFYADRLQFVNNVINVVSFWKSKIIKVSLDKFIKHLIFTVNYY